jgi:hypothetical protein
MNTRLTVKLSSDTNFIPVKYTVVEMSVGTAGDGSDTYCVLIVSRVGWDTKAHYDEWKKNRDATGMQGTAGAFSVAPLSDLEVYDYPRTPSTDM